MNCRLCKRPVVEGKNSDIVEDFAIHTNCSLNGKKNLKPKKKIGNFQEKKKSKKNPFIAPAGTRGWRDIV